MRKTDGANRKTMLQAMKPTDYFNRQIAFHREFVTITGSITAALFLSQALYWSKKTNFAPFYKTQEEWTEETGMSRSEQETARKTLRDIGVIEERYDRLSHRMFYKVNRERMDELLLSYIPECGNPTFGNAGIPHSSNSAETTSYIPPNPQGGDVDFFNEPPTTPPPRFTPEQKRLNALYNRKADAPWGDDELKAWRKLKTVNPDDLQKVEVFYNSMRKGPSEKNYCKRSLLVLLRHWNEVADAARTFKAPSCF